MIRILIAAMAALALGACGQSSDPAGDLDAIARDYLLLQLTIGEKEDGYIDAYYGPPEIQAQAEAEAAANDLPQLAERVAALRGRIAQAEPEDGSLDARRAAFLDAQLVAAQTRLRMMQGEVLSFEDEAEGLFGVRPELPELASFDPLIARIDALVPGEGPLWQRIDAFRSRFDIPADKLKAVMDAGIAECRRRTLAHFDLPEGERFDLALVTDKPWSGYNWYKGGYHSVIQVNTDLPIFIDRAIDLACHEGYPGHHAFNVLLEQRLVRDRGWNEFTVYPLFSPMSLIAEGSANYGIEMAFPGDARARFEAETLFPLAGLDPATADGYYRVMALADQLGYAGNEAARRYLNGEVDAEAAAEWLTRYALMEPARARQRVRFFDSYRSYVINYNLGEDLVRAWVEREAGADPARRWEAFEDLISTPRTASDLR